MLSPTFASQCGIIGEQKANKRTIVCVENFSRDGAETALLVTFVTDPMCVFTENENEEHRSMKLKIFALMLAVALTSVAQSAAPGAPSPKPDAKNCACCNHDKAEAGTTAGCCKDGKCPMMAGAHAGMKCPMMAKNEKMSNGKTCCSSNKCPMHGKGGQGCCGNMDKKPSGM